MTDRQRHFEQLIAIFPQSVRHLLREIPNHAGKLPDPLCKEVLEMLGIQVEDLMVQLLPMAALHAIVPISAFQVGAVARATTHPDENRYDLYLGANIEFRGLPLNQSIHAEQAAIMNAWMQGETLVQTIATSAMPCGHCRQFLKELKGYDNIEIVTPTGGTKGFTRMSLPKLLPKAFGPQDLNQGTSLMAHEETKEDLFVRMVTEDNLVLEALSAATQCYSPYTHNRSGCAIQTMDGQIYPGRYVENAAFNPSMSSIQVAISCMNMAQLGEEPKISRAVLVEKPSNIGQREIAEMILKSVAPGVELEYYQAEG